MLAPRDTLWSTPGEGVAVACDLLRLTSADTVYDVGCGDGRFLVEAAKRGATCVGVEIDAARAAEARAAVEAAGVSDGAAVVVGNGLEVDLSGATAVFLYLIPRGLRLIAPRLLEIARSRPLRVVSYMAPLPGVGPPAKKATCTPAHQPSAAWPLYLYELGPGAAAAAAGGAPPTPDAEAPPPPDAATPPEEAAPPPPPDAETPPPDAATPPPDAATPPEDAASRFDDIDDEDELEAAVEALEQAEDAAALAAVLAKSAREAWEVAGEAAADALNRVAARPVAAADVAAAAVAAALGAFVEEPSVVEVLLSCARRLAPAAPGAIAAAAPAMRAALDEHSDGEATLQEQGCLAVEAVALAGAAHAAALEAAGLRGAVERARESITNERNKTYPDRALAALDAAAAESG